MCCKTIEELLAINASPIEISKLHNFLDVLYKQKKLEILISICFRMAEQYLNQTTQLEWICKIYIEVFYDDKEQGQLKVIVSENIKKYSDQLLAMSPNSTLGLMSQALWNYSQANYINSRELLLKGLKRNSLRSFR